MCMCVSRSLILGENDGGIDDGDGDDELIAFITYLTYPTLHAPVEWQDGRVAEVGGRVR